MRSRVLYFPYIRIPQSVWLTRVLLYWDQVSSIVPSQFTEEPESLGQHMRGLVTEGLVFQVIPRMYIHEVPKFGNAFRRYLDSLGQDADRRRRSFDRGKVLPLHVEKLDGIGDDLVGRHLARRAEYPWYDVEWDTAHDFMSYLATTLGQLAAVDSAPITDKAAYLVRFSRAGVRHADIERQLDLLRTQVLDRILPVPRRPIDPKAIRAFKDRHATELNDFRLRVERELIAAASIADPALRRRHLDLFVDEAEERIGEIETAMRSAGWSTARAGLSVVAAIPGVSPLLGLAGAVWDAVTRGGPRRASVDFAYAAHVRAELTRVS